MTASRTHEREDLVQDFFNRPPLGYAEYGDPHGAPVLAFHGTPGSRIKFRATDAPARALGLRIVAPDRRGYGLSTFAKHDALADWAYDMAALCDTLRIDRFAVMGISGGGPYAVACAESLDSRVSALALVSPVGPVAEADVADQLDWFHRFCFLHLPRSRAGSWLVWHAIRAGFRRAPLATWRLAQARAPHTDVETLRTPGVEERLSGSFREGLAPGIAGALQDQALFAKPWDLPLDQITAPTKIWQGDADVNVPVAAVHHLAEQIPNCTFEELPGQGHLWISINYPVVLQWLCEVVSAPARASGTPGHNRL